MGDVVNLRRFRKRKEKAAKARTADANRAKHGRTKGEKAWEKAETARESAELDSKKLDVDED